LTACGTKPPESFPKATFNKPELAQKWVTVPILSEEPTEEEINQKKLVIKQNIIQYGQCAASIVKVRKEIDEYYKD